MTENKLISLVKYDTPEIVTTKKKEEGKGDVSKLYIYINIHTL